MFPGGADIPPGAIKAKGEDEPGGDQGGKNPDAGFDTNSAISGSSVLNGAQVTAIVGMVRDVGEGTLSKASAVTLMGVAFGIEAKTAERIIGDPKPAPKEPGAEGKRSAEIETRGTFDQGAIGRSFLGVYADAVDRVIRAEERELKKAVSKELTRDSESFSTFLSEFYAEDSRFSKLIRKQMRPTVEALIKSSFDAAASSIKEATDLAGFDDYVSEILDSTVAKHAGASQGMIRKALDAAQESNALASETLAELFEGWKKERAAKVARKETVRLSRAGVHRAFERSGVKKTRWKKKGKSCPFCDSLDGKIIEISGVFASAGEKIFAKGKTPILYQSDVKHPPAHGGCDCELEAAG
jgi:hypothetical protein